ncbi:MAG: ATP-binding protein [Pseudanabaenaceae cyanobacterium bins.39]|nr:ATP-binding protein [Pseudanabaenaceae cyanobacterium bins.39]
MNLHQYLEEQLKEDFNLLKEYEEKLRCAADPREKRKCSNEIQELKQRISKRKTEIQREIEQAHTSKRMPVKDVYDNPLSANQQDISVKPIDFRRQTRQIHLSSEWDTRIEKLNVLRQALAIETSADRKFQLRKQIQEEEKDIADLESELSKIEQDLNDDIASPASQTSSNTTSGDRKSQPASPNFNVYRQEEWVGREEETNSLLEAIKGSCRITVILGITGIGKTALAERIIDELRASQGNLLRDDFYDQTSSNKSFIEVAKEWLRKLGENVPVQERDLESILSLLADKLCHNPYVILIDSLEYILTGNEDMGWGDFVDEGWNKFFLKILLADSCQSSFILTSQDLPSQLRYVGDRYHNFFSYRVLKGLEEAQQMELFQKQGLDCNDEEQLLLSRIGKAYMGHPLALRVIAQEIKIDFHASVAGYWERFGSEIEKVEKSLAAKENEGGQDEWKLDSYSRKLRALVKGRVEITFERLRVNAYIAFELICKVSVYRRPERETAWLMQLEDDYDREEIEQALDILKDRALVEITYDPIRKTDFLGLHSLIRSQALRCRQ